MINYLFPIFCYLLLDLNDLVQLMKLNAHICCCFILKTERETHINSTRFLNCWDCISPGFLIVAPNIDSRVLALGELQNQVHWIKTEMIQYIPKFFPLNMRYYKRLDELQVFPERGRNNMYQTIVVEKLSFKWEIHFWFGTKCMEILGKAFWKSLQ